MLGALAATPAFAAGIATVMDVINDGYRQPPGDAERRAAPADELVSDEALRTARESRIAVRFIDGSELNVEAQSEVVLTEYLFDPSAARASGIITLNAGLFHYNSSDAPDDGVRPVGEIPLEVITVAVLVGVLQLVECGVLLIQQLPVGVEHVVVDHSGKGHHGLPSVELDEWRLLPAAPDWLSRV
jgi:hypothetical protein